MPRRTRSAKTRNREIDEVEIVSFAQLMESRHIKPSGHTSTGRAIYRVMSGGAR